MRDGSLGLLGLALLLASGGGGSRSAPAPTPERLPPGPPAPWPQVIDPGLPTFPGSGWEYDEPPPKAVQQRAQQLVSTLWKQGKGAYKTEQTQGRWITYRAEVVRSGRQGVVAYRVKGSGTLRPPATETTAQRPAPAPAPAGAPAAAPTLTTSPGVPQAPGVPASWNVEVGPAIPGAPELVPTSSTETLPLVLPDLKYGMGLRPQEPVNEVKLVQRRLGLPVDGRFGVATRTAVIEFQKSRGLAPNLPNAELQRRGFGAVKRATWEALFPPSLQRA